jgi:L-rhamnose mutarotase
MQRLALLYRAKPGKRDEYVKAHREIWPQITEGLREAGCHEMTIFCREDLFFLFALIEDIDAFNRIRAKDPYFQRWNQYMHELLIHPFDSEESSAFAPLKEVWRFER